MTFTSVYLYKHHIAVSHVEVLLSDVVPYLAAILLGAVRAADRRGSNGARQLGVGAQHG